MSKDSAKRDNCVKRDVLVRKGYQFIAELGFARSLYPDLRPYWRGLSIQGFRTLSQKMIDQY